jgi:hypothetical protein
MEGRLRRPLTRLVRGQYYYDWHLFSRVSPEDIYLMSFPRSGNTWVRCLLTSYLYDAEVTPALVDETVPDVYRCRQSGEVDKRAFAHMGVFKSHSPYVEIPGKVVYLLRDGRDVMLSLYHYMRKMDARSGRPPSDISAPDFYFRPHAFGTWHEHVLEWLDGLETWPAERYMVMKYEDILADPERCLTALVEFKGLELEPARIARAVERNTKERLAEIDASAGAGALEYPALTKNSWRSVLSPEELLRYEKLAGPALVRAGYPLHSPAVAVPER